jgi:hypothetical protein
MSLILSAANDQSPRRSSGGYRDDSATGHTMRFTFFDLDDLIEISFRVALSGLNLTLNQLVVGRM